MSPARPPAVEVRQTRAADFPGIVALCRVVYPDSPPWTPVQLSSHLARFPEGQFVALDRGGTIVGMAASLVVLWDDYNFNTTWRQFTDAGMFTNHDPVAGRTLYGAEIMVHPSKQGRGVGSAIYRAREALVRRLGLLRIRAGARLRGYHRYADRFGPEEYVLRVIRGELTDPTLTFQLRRGFRVVAVVPGYLMHDPESLGNAAVIEWLNPGVATAADLAAGDPRYRVPRD